MAERPKTTQLHYHGPDRPEPYAIVPVAMFEYDPSRPLSPAARLVRIFLRVLAYRPGWTIYVSHVQRAMRISEAKWASVRRELEAQGYFRSVRSRTADGKWEWQHHVFEAPVNPGVAKAIPPEAGDGGSMDGQQGNTHSLTVRITTPRSSIARERRPVPAAAVGAREPKVKRVVHGMVCWSAAEAADAERIAAVHAPGDVAAAIAGLPAGKSFPGHVEAAIHSKISARTGSGAARPVHGGAGTKGFVESALLRDLRYIEQMHAYGKFSDEARDQERAMAIAKHESRCKDARP
jgi:hypothetical protein